MTDSICTAYENSSGSTAVITRTDNNNITEEIKDVSTKNKTINLFKTVVEGKQYDN